MTITMGDRVALETASHRRDFHARLRENLSNPNSNVWTDIQRLQAERSIARNTGTKDNPGPYLEAVNGMERYLAMRQQVAKSGLPNEAEVNEYHALKERFGGLFSRREYGVTISQVHIDTALTQMMVSFGQGAFVGGEVMPIVKVTKRTGKIYKETIADIQTGEEWMERAPGSEAGEVDTSLDTPIDYSIPIYKAKKGVADDVASEQDAPINLDEMAARKVTTVLTGNREIRIADALQTSTNYASANRITTPSTKWDDADTTDSEHWTQLQAAHNAVSDNSGMAPTDIVLNKRVALALISKDHFRESLIYVDGALPMFLLGKIAEYAMVQRAHIAFGRKTTSNPGQATQTRGDIWDDDVLMLTVDPSPSTHYMGFACSPSTTPLMLARYRDAVEDREREIVWGKEAIDELIVNNVMGAHIADVLT